MGVLARVFEEAGIATVGLSLVRRQAEKVKAPRFLHCEFPLGRPLGKPGDAPFQTDVIRKAFDLLGRTDAPVLEDYPDVIEDEAEEAASCTVPPRFDLSLHAAVDEALGLRPAYNRQLIATDGRTAMGRVGGADKIRDLVTKMISLSEGATLEAVGFDADSARGASQDIRAYYEEAALALSEHVPAARKIETWIYTKTETGKVIRAAAKALQEAGVDQGIWYYLVPGNQH